MTTAYKTDPFALPAGEPLDDAESDSSGNANTFNAGTAVIFGCIGLALGAALGAVITVLINKRKKETAQ